jgi:Tol biopolymer transport system component
MPDTSLLRSRTAFGVAAGLALSFLAAVALIFWQCSADDGDSGSPAARPATTPPAGPQGPPFVSLADLGVRLAYAIVDRTGTGRLVIHNPDDSTIEVEGAQGVFTGIAWSPDGSHLAASFGPSADTQDVYVVDADGSNLTRITDDGQSRRPTWSPDGEQLAFVSAADGPSWPQTVVIIAADGSDRHQISGAVQYDSPAWAPDGSTIAVLPQPGTIRLISPDTGATTREVQMLRESAPSPTSLSWSSDGMWLAAVIARGPGLAVVMLGDDLTAQRQVGGAFLGRPEDPASAQPSFVPDASKIVVASAASGDILVIDVNALPSDLPSTAPYAPVQVLVAAPRGERLVFPAVGPLQAGGPPSSVV